MDGESLVAGWDSLVAACTYFCTVEVAVSFGTTEKVSFFLNGHWASHCGFDPVPGGGSSSGENPRHLFSRPLCGSLASGDLGDAGSSAFLVLGRALVFVFSDSLLGPLTVPDNGSCFHPPAFGEGMILSLSCCPGFLFFSSACETGARPKGCLCAAWLLVGA